VPLKRWFLQEPHNITSQKTAFFKPTYYSKTTYHHAATKIVDSAEMASDENINKNEQGLEKKPQWQTVSHEHKRINR
jgi:hypothetical protein